jgi:hypothetical protein
MRSIMLALAAVGIVALVTAPPADAQSRKPRTETRSDSGQNWQGSGRYSDVFVAGRNMGTDPDPRIRSQIRRDVGAAVGGLD